MVYQEPEPTPPMASLGGRTVGVLQTRHNREFAALIERHGGRPLLAPTLREVPAQDRTAVRDALGAIAASGIDIAIFQTGVGARAFFSAATESGRYEVILDRLASSIVVARGPKPLAVLHEHRVRVDRRTAEPHTTAQVMDILDSDLTGKAVLLLEFGAPNQALLDFLVSRRAKVIDVTVYGWDLPLDVAPVLRFLDQLEAGAIDITTFTSASQVENLFRIAEQKGVADKVPGWLQERTMVAAIGPVAARALGDHGVSVRIQPRRPKMVPFIRAICEHFSATATSPQQQGTDSDE
jgi:uroporphyrinogen-III synthase